MSGGGGNPQGQYPELGSVTGRVAFRHQGNAVSRLRIYAYGQDDRVPNPGDLLLVSIMGSAESLVEVAFLLRGEDMHTLAQYVSRATVEYVANADWLKEPVTRDRSREAG